MNPEDSLGRRHDDPATRTEESGIALILSLLVLVLLIIIIFQISYSTKIELRLAKSRLDGSVLHYATDGVLVRAKAYLQADSSENQWDAPGDLWETAAFAADEGSDEFDDDYDPWADDVDSQEGEIELEVQIIDEDRKLNLSLLAERPEPKETNTREDRNARRGNRNNQERTGANSQQQQRAPRNEAAEKKQREHVFEALISVLVDFRDDTRFDLSGTEARSIAEQIRDHVTRPKKRGAGDGEIPSPETLDAPILTVDELLMLPDVTEELLFDFVDEDDQDVIVPGLLNFVTIWSSGLVNINTAPPAVIRSLFSKDNRDAAEKILEYRDEYEAEDEDERRIRERESGSEDAETPGIFKDVAELQSNNLLTNEEYQEILPYISAQSSVFSIYVSAKRGKVERRTRTVMRRVNGQVYPMFTELRKDRPLLNKPEEEEGDDGGFFF